MLKWVTLREVRDIKAEGNNNDALFCDMMTGNEHIPPQMLHYHTAIFVRASALRGISVPAGNAISGPIVSADTAIMLHCSAGVATHKSDQVLVHCISSDCSILANRNKCYMLHSRLLQPSQPIITSVTCHTPGCSNHLRQS